MASGRADSRSPKSSVVAGQGAAPGHELSRGVSHGQISVTSRTLAPQPLPKQQKLAACKSVSEESLNMGMSRLPIDLARSQLVAHPTSLARQTHQPAEWQHTLEIYHACQQ
ncbi:hypothetical protein LTR53_000642 [Teratosphaeriaceae sp. CCFEE 6253]|nr:hypothetical protein LTR53_000642 [Teratosphaeriaceae sp. CCFEE 6253]